MLFNSFPFLVFFITVYAAYLALNHRFQNRMLLVASYVFYGWWDPRFLSLIFASTVIDYFCGLRIEASRTPARRRLFLVFSVAANLGILGFFKYFNFFAENLRELFLLGGMDLNPVTLNIVLPVGISFYTFQTMSYTIDIYRGEMKPTRHFLDFALFVAFFPKLVAGPIERARHLLPQVLNTRSLSVEKFREGSYLILLGLFQKIVVADNLARIVDPVFTAAGPYQGGTVLLALYAFAFQIFCDFAGYSNIARGLGKLMGFDLMVNFREPYFSSGPREFWHRWHISLSTWLRDYLYISLGGNQKGTWRLYRNLMITMLLGGLWHGASWTFVIWGTYHGVLLVFYRLVDPVVQRVKAASSPFLKRCLRIFSVFLFFHLTCYGWLLFRAQSTGQIASMTAALFQSMNLPDLFVAQGDMLRTLAGFLWLLIPVEILQFRKNSETAVLRLPLVVRWTFYVLAFHMIAVYAVGTARQFIYFQF